MLYSEMIRIIHLGSFHSKEHYLKESIKSIRMKIRALSDCSAVYIKSLTFQLILNFKFINLDML